MLDNTPLAYPVLLTKLGFSHMGRRRVVSYAYRIYATRTRRASVLQTNRRVGVSFCNISVEIMASSVPDVFGEFIDDLTFTSDEEDFLLFDFVRSRKRRAHWIHPYIANNYKKRLFVAARELSENDNKFRSFYRMRKDTFTILRNILGPIGKEMFRLGSLIL